MMFEEAKERVEKNHNEKHVFQDIDGNYRIAYWAEGIQAVCRTPPFKSEEEAREVANRK